MSLEKIKQVVGKSGYSDNPQDILPYATAWRGGHSGKSPLVAFPTTTTQVSEIVKLCVQSKIALIPQGGNTGLVSGTVPSNSEIIINLSRMNKIRSIDVENFTVTAEAGCILQKLQEEAESKNRLFPLSIASEGSAELGGLIATNAGGSNVLRYGHMRDLVFGVEAVLPNGEIWNGLRSLKKDNTGYDLKQLLIGSEGTLGIITAATCKLFPLPRQTVSCFAAIDTIEKAVKLLAFLREEIGDSISAFEIISAHCLELVTKNIDGSRNPLSKSSPYYLLIEIATPQQGDSLKSQMEKILTDSIEHNLVDDVVIAGSIKQAEEFWNIREHIPEAIKKAGKGIHFDIAVPIGKIPSFKNSTDKKITSKFLEIKLACFGHVGDGNLHYNMYLPTDYDSNKFSSVKQALKDIVYDAVIECQGSISAEHGIGLERREDFYKYKNPVEIAAMKSIKSALDPDNLFNPGKIV